MSDEDHKIVNDWIKGGEVLERWGIDAAELAYHIFDRNLSAYSIYGYWVTPNPGPHAWMAGPGMFLRKSDFGVHIGRPIEEQKRIINCMVKFDMDDIEKFEKEHNIQIVEPPDESSNETDLEPLNAKEKRELGKLRKLRDSYDQTLRAAIDLVLETQDYINKNNQTKPTKKELKQKLLDNNKGYDETMFNRIWAIFPSKFKLSGAPHKISES